MTTKRRLTDMLREEVNKSSTENKAPEQTSQADSKSIDQPTSEPVIAPTIKLRTEQVELISESNSINNQQEAMLKNELAQAEAKIVSLSTELSRTQSYLAQASQVKTDLDAAVAENVALKAEIAELKGQNSQLAKTQTKAPLARAEQEKLRISQLLHRPVGSNAEQNRINNQNIGWFD